MNPPSTKANSLRGSDVLGSKSRLRRCRLVLFCAVTVMAGCFRLFEYQLATDADGPQGEDGGGDVGGDDGAPDHDSSGGEGSVDAGEDGEHDAVGEPDGSSDADELIDSDIRIDSDMGIDADIGDDADEADAEAGLDAEADGDGQVVEVPGDGCWAPAVPMTVDGWTDMVICRGRCEDQCTAHLICETGWSLCTASEYRARGGTEVGIDFGAYIASCVREPGRDPFAPTDAVCDSCGWTMLTQDARVTWYCDDHEQGDVYDDRNLGVMVSDTCRFIGVDEPDTYAYWAPIHAWWSGNGSVCCRQ